MKQTFLFLLPLLMGTLFQAAHAGTGYRTDFDYSNQGDDWYGRSLPDPRRDFPASPVDEASEGDDFGLGFEILSAAPGFGPPLASTRDASYEYRFRFGDRYTDWQECYVDANCDDTVFCNGAEWCNIQGTCSAGAPPSCDDGNPCTSNACNISLDLCQNDPLPDPGEVPFLTLATHPGTTVATLRWSNQAAAETYNVYRGEKRDLSDMICYESFVLGTSLDDDGTFGAKGLYEFLVNSNGCGGTSSLGTDSLGAERKPFAWCP